MNQSLPTLYRLANEAANQLAAAVECRPHETAHLFDVLAQTVRIIGSNRRQMTLVEAEIAGLIAEGFERSTPADLAREGVTALKELLHEFLGARALTPDRRERARTLAARWCGTAAVLR